jgi:hypothetical protein
MQHCYTTMLLSHFEKLTLMSDGLSYINGVSENTLCNRPLGGSEGLNIVQTSLLERDMVGNLNFELRPTMIAGVRARLHVRFCVRSAIILRVQFPLQGILQLNVQHICPDMACQSVVMGLDLLPILPRALPSGSAAAVVGQRARPQQHCQNG